MFRVKDFDVRIYHAAKGRLDYRVLMPRLLRLARKSFGFTGREIRATLRKHRVDAIAPAALRNGSQDALVVGILARRIEVILDMLGARIWRDELPERTVAQMSRDTRRVTHTYKASTKRDLLDALRKISGLRLLAGDRTTRSQGMAILLMYVICEWRRSDPKYRADPVFLRDDYRCLAPGCSARGHLHDHHVDFKSRGGSNALYNRIALCWFHHKLLHEGRITVTGRADGILYWRLGQSQPRYYMGNVLLRKSWEQSPRRDGDTDDVCDLAAAAPW
jgi:5-methylcytosine-specific restriction endonuclease McrA